MSTKSREYLYGHSVRYSAEKAKLARQEADRLAVDAWNKRMLGFKESGAAVADTWRCAQCRVSLS